MYSSTVNAKGGINGQVRSSDDKLQTETYMPTGARDDTDQRTNPEQLFAASYASCLDGTLHHVAQAKSIELKNAEVDAEIQALQVEKGDLRFKLKMEVKIPYLDRKEAEKLLQEAWENCPVTKATKNSLEVELNLAHS